MVPETSKSLPVLAWHVFDRSPCRPRSNHLSGRKKIWKEAFQYSGWRQRRKEKHTMPGKLSSGETSHHLILNVFHVIRLEDWSFFQDKERAKRQVARWIHEYSKLKVTSGHVALRLLISVPLATQHELYDSRLNRKALRIAGDPIHPSHCFISLLPSGDC